MRIGIIQKIIDVIRMKKNVPPLFILDKLMNKIYTFEQKKEQIDTIALGSSHCEYGFRASEKQMNLGISYQDLYYSYQIYKKYNNKNIKNVVIFYSVFSPGYQLIKTNDAYLAIAFKIICNIPYQDCKIAENLNLEKLEKYYLNKYKKTINNFAFNAKYSGNEEKYESFFNNVTAEQRAIPHYKNNQRHNNQNQYLGYISEVAKQYNQKIYIIIPPATQEYKKLLPSSEELFSELYDTAQNLDNLQVINCYDISFDKNEFVDWDHLGLKGAERLTKIINDNMAKTRMAAVGSKIYEL